MKNYYSLLNSDWNSALDQLLANYSIYAPFKNIDSSDYELVNQENIYEISYNIPKPTTPLKTFFLPIKENLIVTLKTINKRIIIGTPNCDIQGLNILDEIYLDKDYIDTAYKDKRDNTLLIATSCYETQEHCHCMAYDIRPFSKEIADISLSHLDGKIHLEVLSEKGEKFIIELKNYASISNSSELEIKNIELKQSKIENTIIANNTELPDYKKTGEIVQKAKEVIWSKYSSKCVSCGACASICPTCTCFLLVDKPEFEKVRQLDACQYPGFERVAGDEDALHELSKRFRNRYFCKYVWKPQKFKSLVCTGCGRCIEACIGKINKNELFKELAN
ncbi:MAG: 4Fe-4S dicluster domain-containing protein [Bacteroidales bacterium]|jgi:sulfhydrogenase subunit beta (sulfur reductase)|nr:4Fe-4S dicluster domain-containing protein [Bacteroidales bacterium]